MKLKTSMSLTVAIILGLITAKVGMDVMKNAGGGKADRTSKVLVAKRDMVPGYIIQPGDLGLTEVSVNLVPEKALHEMKDGEGRTVIASIVSGQTILDAMMAPKGAGSGLAALLRNGMRAVAIDISDSSAVAGMLSPGSKVDVIATLRRGDQQIATPIVENVEVQSLQRQVTGYSTREGMTTAMDNGPVKSVTLLVTPKQGSRIELANASGGRLRLMLRGNGDMTTNDSTVTENEITGTVEATKPVEAPVADVFENTPPPVEDKGRPVQLIQGGKMVTVYMNDKSPEETVAPPPPSASKPKATANKKSKPVEGEPQPAAGTSPAGSVQSEERTIIGEGAK